MTGGPEPLTADELIAELERASKEAVYSVSASEPVALDEHAVMVTGRMRWRLPQGGFEEAGHVWLLIVRDGLIYRQGVYDDAQQADRCLRGARGRARRDQVATRSARPGVIGAGAAVSSGQSANTNVACTSK